MPILSDSLIRSVVIAGAGGFGLEVFDYLERQTRAGGPQVSGFIDDNPDACLPESVKRPHLGAIQSFRPQADQVVIVAIGKVKGRLKVLETLWQNQVQTPAFVADSVFLSPSATIGTGALICPFAIINHGTQLGKGVVVNVHCFVGHGAKVGDHSILSPYAALNGDASIGKKCFLGTRATIYPRITIGDTCVVSSHTGVRLDAEANKFIAERSEYQVSEKR